MSTPGTRPLARPVLVAGIGNIFLGDDGFGVETVRRLAQHPLPDGVELVDTGVRGVHLAFQLLDGYGTVVLVDAVRRGGPPGTVRLIEADEPGEPREAVVDGHRMTPDAVLALLDTLSAGTGGSRPRRVLIVGCEPACLDEGMALSAPVAAAVDEAVRLVLRLVRARPPEPARSRQQGPRHTATDDEGVPDHVEDPHRLDGDGGARLRGGAEPAGHPALPADALHVTADRGTPPPRGGVADRGAARPPL